MKSVYKYFLVISLLVTGLLLPYRNIQADNSACDAYCKIGETITFVPGTCCPAPWETSCPEVMVGQRYGMCLNSIPTIFCSDSHNYSA